MSVFESLKLMDASYCHIMYSKEFCYTNIPAQSMDFTKPQKQTKPKSDSECKLKANIEKTV